MHVKNKQNVATKRIGEAIIDECPKSVLIAMVVRLIESNSGTTSSDTLLQEKFLNIWNELHSGQVVEQSVPRKLQDAIAAAKTNTKELATAGSKRK